MTDPFKNQRYSSISYSSVSEPISSKSSNYQNLDERSLNLTKSIDQSSPEEFNVEKQAFIQAHMDANRELISQLKSNIELLYKGTRLVGQFALYPLKVIRWQSQIHSESVKYHLTPFTLMPVFYNLNHNGYLGLWKGCFSMAVYNGVKVILESVLGEVTSFEKNIEDVKKKDKLYGHILLKCISSALTTPILSAVIYESVQSGIVHENLGLVDLLKETWNRITGYKYNFRTRLIPFWSLILPSSLYFLGMNFLSFGFEKFLRKIIVNLLRFFDEKRNFYDEVEQEVVENPYVNALAQLSGEICAIVALYPIETVTNRLIVQGTRTIIDNTDYGYGVVPINTRYEGFIDCVQTINQTEGVFGFYKGIGAVAIEATLYFLLFKLAKLVAYRLYDSEWISRTDSNAYKNLMTSSTYARPSASITSNTQNAN